MRVLENRDSAYNECIHTFESTTDPQETDGEWSDDDSDTDTMDKINSEEMRCLTSAVLRVLARCATNRLQRFR